ncbi:MAG: hypothetical protein ACYTEO_01950 [Planctomycetota bacterium]|jgi:hypothetical protein
MIRTFLFWLFFSVFSSPILFALTVVVIIASLLATRKMSRNYRTAWRGGVILLTVLVLSFVSACKIQRFRSHVVDPKAYQAVKVGMTKQQVANFLGVPPDKNLATWRYDKPGVFEFVTIYFDVDGRVKEKFLDR